MKLKIWMGLSGLAFGTGIVMCMRGWYNIGLIIFGITLIADLIVQHWIIKK